MTDLDLNDCILLGDPVAAEGFRGEGRANVRVAGVTEISLRLLVTSCRLKKVLILKTS